MNPKRVIWALATASILTSVPVSTVRTEATQHPGQHGSVNLGPDRGPLPAAVRHATEQFRDLTAALAAGTCRTADASADRRKGQWVSTTRTSRSSTRQSTSRRPRCSSTNRETDDSTWSRPVRHARRGVGSAEQARDTSVDGTPAAFCARTEPVRSGRVLRAARLGVEGQPAWDLCRLESQRVLLRVAEQSVLAIAVHRGGGRQVRPPHFSPSARASQLDGGFQLRMTVMGLASDTPR